MCLYAPTFRIPETDSVGSYMVGCHFVAPTRMMGAFHFTTFIMYTHFALAGANLTLRSCRLFSLIEIRFVHGMVSVRNGVGGG